MQHTFRVSKEDEKILNALCFHLERNLADTVRFALRELARSEGILYDKPNPYLRELNDQQVDREEVQ